MAPAGVFSLVPRAGGRAALLAAMTSVSPRPSTASLGTARRMEVAATTWSSAPNRHCARTAIAVGMATAGIFSSVPGMGGGPWVRGRAASIRSTPVHTTALLPATARRREVASAVGVVSSLGASRLPATRSMVPTFAAATSAGSIVVRSRAHVLSNAGKGSMETTPAQEPPTPQGLMSKFAEGLMSKFTEALKKMKVEVQKSAFTILFLLISVVLACVALKGKNRASDVIEICEKAEKNFKFTSHFIPIVIALWKFLW